jgi:hypothetical protein
MTTEWRKRAQQAYIAFCNELEQIEVREHKSRTTPRFVKCIRSVPLYGQQTFDNCLDPDLKEGCIYEVVVEMVDVMNDDPWITIRLPNGRDVSRPRYYFGPILN